MSNAKLRRSVTMALHYALLEKDPNYKKARIEIEKFVQLDIKQQSSPLFRRRITKIPVVVHIVYKNDDQNISDKQVHSQIQVLNQDFRKLNSDLDLIPDVFQSNAGDAAIEFQLAVQDPNGKNTSGITRTKTDVTRFIVDIKKSKEPMKFDNQGGKDAWPRDNYLNIWVCNTGGDPLGYARFPGTTTAERDGIVIDYKNFGNIGTAEHPYNGGRTATHEGGHWLNLLHIWGDDGGGCSGSDNVADTPNQAGPNYGCPSFPHITCNNEPDGDMFMNFMDYTDDVCMHMFTEGQIARMHATLRGPRSSLLNSQGLSPTDSYHTMRIGPQKLGAEYEKGTTQVFDGCTWIQKEEFSI